MPQEGELFSAGGPPSASSRRHREIAGRASPAGYIRRTHRRFPVDGSRGDWHYYVVMNRNTNAGAETAATRVTVSMASDLSRRFESFWKREGFPTRSEAIESLIRAALVRSEWEAGSGDVAGVVTLVYDHHEKALVGALIDIQHEFDRMVIAAQHAHLDHDNCLETIIVRGSPKSIQRFERRLRFLKGIKHIALIQTTTAGGS